MPGSTVFAIVMVRQQTWQESKNSSQSPLVCNWIANAISKPGIFCQASIADHLFSNCCSFNQKRRAIGFTLGQHRPDHPRHLVGQRNRRHLNALAGGELSQPRVQAV